MTSRRRRKRKWQENPLQGPKDPRNKTKVPLQSIRWHLRKNGLDILGPLPVTTRQLVCTGDDGLFYLARGNSHSRSGSLRLWLEELVLDMDFSPPFIHSDQVI
ncbi:hypothetical protein AVEN_20365-1 [Araneus ventricosus]|uniref:Uncharacterized protein n=1 Tax=Araneus ventricosus TaxID=182803 RepID=A0A4Y2FUS7_ARAVE|nr:hypothetical protein AVEN_20365-1 [Araneus ventricosus]